MNRSHSRSGIFLMELIAAILFFSLVSALCLRIFVKSSQMSTDTKNLNLAVSEARNVIELMKNAASPAAVEQSDGSSPFLDCILKEYPDAKQEAGRLLICYDKDWQRCTEKDGRYCLKIIPEEENTNGLSIYQIRVSDMESETDTIYSFDLKLHMPALS